MISSFNIPIYKSVIPPLQFSQIKEDVSNYIKNNPQNFKTIWDCPTLSDLGTKRGGAINSTTLIESIKASTEEYYNEWEFTPHSLNIDDLWINIAPQGAFQEAHKHLSRQDKILFSGVLYIDTLPSSGDIVFENPLEIPLSLMPPSNKILTKIKIQPKDNTIIMFPSWISHYVGTNNSDKTRISVSWNIKINN